MFFFKQNCFLFFILNFVRWNSVLNTKKILEIWIALNCGEWMVVSDKRHDKKSAFARAHLHLSSHWFVCLLLQEQHFSFVHLNALNQSFLLTILYIQFSFGFYAIEFSTIFRVVHSLFIRTNQIRIGFGNANAIFFGA